MAIASVIVAWVNVYNTVSAKDSIIAHGNITSYNITYRGRNIVIRFNVGTINPIGVYIATGNNIPHIKCCSINCVNIGSGGIDYTGIGITGDTNSCSVKNTGIYVAS